MRACPTCSGFLPGHLTRCPHCDAKPGRWQRLGRALAMFAGSTAALVTMSACYGVAPYYDGCPDSDQDGWLPGCYNDDHSCDPDDLNCDCNDADGTIHPGADDPPDGVDRDCDGKDGQSPNGPHPDASVPLPDASIWVDGGAEADAAPPDSGV
jgi:hypothetical protein